MSRTRAARIGVGALWATVVVVAVALTIQRYRAALADPLDVDLDIFVKASLLLRNGGSPYDAAAYVYSPVLAWILSPFPDLASVRPLWCGVGLASAWGTVAAVVATIWGRIRGWQRPLVALVGITTLLYNTATVNELWLGQVDLVVLFLAALSVLLASRGYRAWSGAVIAVGGVLKSWPGLLGLWLLRRGAGVRGIVSAAITAAGLLLAILVAFGPATFPQWIARTASLSQQPLLAYSVWGFGRFLFTSNPVMPPLFVAPVLAWAIGIVLAVGVVVLLVIALRNPGSDSFAMWHTASAVVLLMPVSHIPYRLLMLPLLWLWLVEAFRRPGLRTVGALAVFAVFWIVTFRLPVLLTTHTTDHLQFSAIMIAGLAALTVSVLGVRGMERDRELSAGIADPPSRGDSKSVPVALD